MDYEGPKNVKGRALKGYLAFVKKKWGVDGLNECQKSVSTDVFNVQEEKWYPNQNAEEVLGWIKDAHGIDAVRQAGISLVSNTGIVSFAARLAGMERILDRAMDETRESLNFGDVTVEKGNKTAIVHLKDLTFKEETCVVWGGILEGLFGLTKTKGTVTKTDCQLDGGQACTYEMVWGK